MQEQRKKFSSTQVWQEYIASQTQANGELIMSGIELNKFRTDCYKAIENLRGRPLLVYAAQFVDGAPQEAQTSIALGDVDGFTDLINSIPAEEKSVDILLHSPGGSPDATERIVELLRSRFDEVHFLIPHSAYSAATMLAMSGDTITLHPSAVLGPIDPQINGIPARSIRNGFDKAKKKLADEGPQSLPAYIPLIEKYTLELLEICEDSEKLSKQLVEGWIAKYMFKGQRNGVRIKSAVKYMADYDRHLIHSRALSFEKLSGYRLNISHSDTGLSELLWEAHVLLNGMFTLTPFVKLYESTHNVSWGRQFIQAPTS